MIIGIRGWQDTGKTAIGIAIARELLLFGGYKPDEFVGNVNIAFEGAHILNNDQLKKYIISMIPRDLLHKLVFIDEADRVFPARFWQDKEQTFALLGLWQDEKCFHNVIYTAHNGTGVDITLRNTTQIEIEPYGYIVNKDEINYTVYNALDGKVYDDVLRNVRNTIFPLYDRWARVK